MRETFLISIIFILSINAHTQDNSTGNENEIIDPVINDSFFFQRKQQNILVPVELRSRHQDNSGFAVVSLVIDLKNRIKSYKVLKIQIDTNNVRVLDYVSDQGNEKPIELEHVRIMSGLKSSIEHYIYKEVIIKRKDRRKTDRDFRFLIRMK